MSLANKRILLGISGGIAAYKSADLLRRLQDAGAEVRVMMTDEAQQFVTALTFEALSGAPVLTNTDRQNGMLHIELARWADLILIAPATANTLSKLAQGAADDLISTTCLASSALLAVAPAMNQQMWNNPATQANLDTLHTRGVTVLGPASGYQACGETGEGRMLEPAELVQGCESLFNNAVLAGLHVLVTAGPTIEPIDPVRYISNRSSGKMGYAIATAAQEMGARVTLVSGPVNLSPPERVDSVAVQSAQQMLDAVMTRIPQTDIFISAAAVADYAVSEPVQNKLKKTADTLTLTLTRNPDILATVCQQAKNVFCVGFAAETDNLIDNARSKLTRKQADMIAANLVGDQAAANNTGFDSDENELTLVTRSGEQALKKASKTVLARQLMELVKQHYEKTATENS